MLFGIGSESGPGASWLQSSRSSAGGSTSTGVEDGPAAVSEDSPLTARKALNAC